MKAYPRASVNLRQERPVTIDRLAGMIDKMQLSSTLAWLIDEAGASPDADRFLADLGARLIDEALPLAGGALTLAAPHPIIAHRTWLWRSAPRTSHPGLAF